MMKKICGFDKAIERVITSYAKRRVNSKIIVFDKKSDSFSFSSGLEMDITVAEDIFLATRKESLEAAFKLIGKKDKGKSKNKQTNIKSCW